MAMKIAVIGAGNVATHLALALAREAEVVQIMSRTEESSALLAEKINSFYHNDICAPITSPSLLRPDCDLYLISVSDSSIASVVESTPDFPGIWVHTSGSVPQTVFAGRKSRYGVFYPLQTFTRDIPVDLRQVPMMISGCDKATADTLCALASTLSERVKIVDDSIRQSIHVAAVFACNFANMMWVDADELLREQGLDVTYFLPLIQAQLDKLRTMSPRDAMTGPARRNDGNVIDFHLSKLSGAKRADYEHLTARILELYGLDPKKPVN